MKNITCQTDKRDNVIYLIYDGECILCRQCSKALKLKKSVGELQIINARSDHPLVHKVHNQGYDLNEGIVVKYENNLYHGTDALHLLALMTSQVDLFNRLSAQLFKYKFTTRLFYPVFKAIRNLLLLIYRVQKIKGQSNIPAFKVAFGKQWSYMPEIFRTRYGNCAFKNQTIRIKGALDIYVSRFFSYLSPLLRLAGALMPYDGKQVPVTVEFKSTSDAAIIYMNRTFYYPNRNPHLFNSKLLVAKKGNVIELMRFGIGIKMSYSYANDKVVLKHQGYIWRIFGKNILIPLTILLGKAYAHEKAISPENFSMLVKITHPLFGKIFEYKGTFQLAYDNEESSDTGCIR